MGYTHYYERKNGSEISDESWQVICDGTRDIIKRAGKDGIKLDRAKDSNQKLSVTKKHIWFNGVEDDAHETFYIEKIASHAWLRSSNNYTTSAFCKTNRKPYDAVVVSVLALIKAVVGKEVLINSDGVHEGVWQNIPYKVEGIDYSKVEEITESVSAKEFFPKPSKETDFKISLNLTIDTAGQDVEKVADQLHEFIRHGIEEGLITNTLKSTIENWNAEVTCEG